jgi:hypothetical protein
MESVTSYCQRLANIHAQALAQQVASGMEVPDAAAFMICPPEEEVIEGSKSNLYLLCHMRVVKRGKKHVQTFCNNLDPQDVSKDKGPMIRALKEFTAKLES